MNVQDHIIWYFNFWGKNREKQYTQNQKCMMDFLDEFKILYRYINNIND